MKLIGLTGGIASGKSTAGRMLKKAGVPVIDADVLARDAVAIGTDALAAVVARFGGLVDGGVLDADGNLDRKKLGALVFANDELRHALNAIVHPAVAQLAVDQLQVVRDSGAPVAVYEVPLLFEKGLEAGMDASILIALDDAVQVQRVMARDGLDEAAARARIASQMSLAEKKKRATVVVDNGGSVGDLATGLADAFERVTGIRLDLAP